jgi:hypothetical protein
MTSSKLSQGLLRGGLLAVSLAGASLSAQAALEARDRNADTVIDGYYDTVLNITWWANANAAAGSPQDDGFITNDGFMSWQNANDWLNAFQPFGTSGWRLPNIDVSSSCSGYLCNTTGSELGHMYYGNLGGLPNSGVSSALFSDIRAGQYWARQLNLLDLEQAITLDFSDGYQDADFKIDPVGAVWAVADGDVLAAVPEPGTYAMLGLGLLALAGVKARRRL